MLLLGGELEVAGVAGNLSTRFPLEIRRQVGAPGQRGAGG